jgi:hypothetical protein
MGYVMAQAVILWPLEAEAQVHSHASPCGIFCGRYGPATGVYLRVLGLCFVSIIARAHLFITNTL